MNKTNVTTRKGSKSKTKKESQEVFVLPPNLLEKLGIHLGSYGSAPESTVGSQVADPNLISKENESSVNKLTCKNDSDSHVTTSSEIESSIIETAELMKKSVFLSPTFISNNTSVIQGEIEIVGNAETEDIEVSAGLSINECSAKKAEELSIDIHKGHISISNVETSSSNPTSLSTDKNIQHDQIANGNVEMNDVRMQTLLDDHADEAYSSDCSNSNMGCTVRSELKSNHNKINIISEQIILPSQFYKLKSNYSPKENSLIQVSINTMINSQNSINQNSLDLIPNIAGNIVPTEITIVSEGDMYGQHFEEGDTNLPMEDNESIHNINKIDLCALLNQPESEFIIATQQENSQQDLEVLKNPHKNYVITKDDMATCIVLPCLIDVDNGSNKRIEDSRMNTEMYSEHRDNAVKETSNVYDVNSCIDETKCESIMNKRREDVSTNTQMYSEHSDNAVKETFNVYNTDSCIDETKGENIMNKRTEDISTNTQMYSEHSDNAVKESFNVSNTNSCIDDTKGENIMNKRTEDISKNTQMYTDHSDNAVKGAFNIFSTDLCIDETMSENIASETLSKESKSDILADNNKRSVMSSIIEAENESKNTPGNKYSAMEVNLQTKYISGNKYAYEEVLSSKKESTIPEQNNTEQLSILQNGVTDSINHEKADSLIDNKETNQNVLENPSESAHHSQLHNWPGSNTIINKAKCSSDTLQMKQNKSNPVPKTSSSPIFYVRREKKPVSENNEHDEDHGKQKIKHENSNLNEIKISHTESLKSNTLKVANKNKASVIQEDKVREIAKYLSEFADMKKRNHFIDRHKTASSKTLSNKKSTIYSKSTIQGVEKPGGSEIKKQDKNYPPIKTYGRRSIQRRKTITSSESLFKESNTSTQSINLTDNSSSKKNCYDMEECLCYDFGRLKSYDEVSSYEHIHFWNTAQTDCTPEIIFSIYSENAPAAIVDNEVMKVIEEYPSKTSHETLYKLCWNQLKAINGNGFDDCDLRGESELDKKYILSSDKKISAYADNENVEKKKSNEKLEVEKEVVWQNNKMVNVNSLQKCEGIVSGEHSAKSGQKRTRSIALSDDGEPPAKNSKRRISKRFSLTKEGQTYIDEQTSGKISTNDVSPIKTPSTPLSETTSLSAEQACTFSNKTPTNSRDRTYAPFHDTIETGQHQTGSCIPLNTSTSKRFDQPSMSLNVAGNIPEPQTKILEKVDTTHQLCKKENKNKTVICGVCLKSVEGADWINHIASQHKYLAWKNGEPSLDVDDDAAVREHLYGISKVCGGLTCAKCGITRKYVKAYLSHVRGCTGLDENLSEVTPSVKSVNISVKNEGLVNDGLIKCGVCEESIQDTDWNDHRASRHDYLSWKFGEPPLDVNNEAAVREHLYDITKACGGLTCAKCGITRKYVKAYLSHIRNCTGLSESLNDSAYDISSEVIPEVESADLIGDKHTVSANTDSIKCGVCKESVEVNDWNHHIASRHDYLAWKLGDAPLDVNDEAAIKNHLYEITKTFGGLTCAKCGLVRKYVKAYMSHIKRCDGLNESQNDSTCNASSDAVKLTALVNGHLINTETSNEEAVSSTALVKCAVCDESMQEKDWNSHIAARHDYLAWKLGDTALDVNDETAVRDHLYEITKACGGLTCVKCGLTRKYVKSYLNHFKNCNGLSESQNDTSMSTEVSGVDLAESANSSTKDVKEENELLVKCAVCAKYVLETNWNSHIASQHDYLAWKDGEKCLDVQDEEAVRQHLRQIEKQNGGLTCAKCGTHMKCVESHLKHVKSCHITLSDLEDSSQNLVLERRASVKEGQILSTSDGDSSLVKCGVCGQDTANNDWTQHIAASHGYLAWKDGQPPLNMTDEKEVRVHLRAIVKKVGILICPKCDVPHKTVKSYLHHTSTCGETQEDVKSSFKCGVCNESVVSLLWEKHLSEKHYYLAWKDGDTPVNVDDEEGVHEHLYNLSKQFGSLICSNCGLRRKYVKSYMEHIKGCKNGDITEAGPEETPDDLVVDFNSGGTCAVCHKGIEAEKWIQHTQRDHNYLAWREGEKPWNLDDFEDLNQYLYVICKKMEGLTCNKCGIVRKYVKTYLTHIKSCDVTDFNLDSSVAEGVGPLNKDEVQCAICKKQMKRSQWKTHAMKKHYNISWIIGETPIDIKNPYAVEKYLKEYKQVYGSLKCNVCNASRASFAGFYAHIIVCGKTEEEIDVFRSVCDICNNTYLCIYKNQHAMIHRVQEYTAELKIKKTETASKLNTEPNLSGKRRAAVKARSVIENYSDNISKHAHSCQSCGFGTDFEDELKTHKCEVSNEKDFSGDESSAAEIGSSDDESGDTDVDSNISNEVNDNEVDDDDEDDECGLLIKKRVRHREPAPVLSKVSRIPFKVDDPNSYIRQGDEDFCNTYLTDEVLFPQWQCQLGAVLDSEITRYLPPLEQSCKVKYDSGWKRLNRFEAKKDHYGSSIFVGASIVCIGWAPLRVGDIRDGSTNFLAVACHNGPDCPRYQGDEMPNHENLIQIWNFSKFDRLPQIVLGIAHDFGTVWSMDWCPSGARDALPDGEEATRRLGLLAVACSNGSAYIFAVPYPSTDVKNNEFIRKMKPVAELRMTMGSERKRYQATSVSWSKQRGHTLVLVGYADGSTAYYDLHSTSPLLLTIENDVQVFHPYNDERPHNTCITGTGLYPVEGDAATCGAGVFAAPTGAELVARAGAGAGGPARARLPTASLAVAFAPHACCAVLGGDDAIMHTAISELAWVPPGRRLGGIRSLGGCARCGRVVVSTPPILRVMRPHPAYCDAKKQVVGLLEMTHLAKKRKKQVNDELAMILEPLTYDDAIIKYGITFKTIGRNDKVMQHECSAKPKAHCPERFPLADVKSMAFCPSRRYHEKLALATHSGILFLATIK